LLDRAAHSLARGVLYRHGSPPQSHAPQRLRLVAPIDTDHAVVRFAEIKDLQRPAGEHRTGEKDSLMMLRSDVVDLPNSGVRTNNGQLFRPTASGPAVGFERGLPCFPGEPSKSCSIGQGPG